MSAISIEIEKLVIAEYDGYVLASCKSWIDRNNNYCYLGKHGYNMHMHMAGCKFSRTDIHHHRYATW